MLSHYSKQISWLKGVTQVAVGLAAVIGSTSAAQALNFNFSYAPGTSLEQMLAFEMAGNIWSSYITDNTTVNIYIETTNDLPENVIGGALPGIAADRRYQDWRNKLGSDRTSAQDNLAFNNMQDETDKFTALIDGYKIDNNEKLNMTRANAKALNMLSGNPNDLDGYIVMSNLANLSNVSWNYDVSSNTVSNNSLDFLSVGVHEIGHILGFVSGVDKPGWLSQKTEYNQNNIDDYYASLIGTLNNATPLDMFRYSAESIAEGGLSEHWIDMSVGGNPYFSVNGGQTALGYFASGEDTSLGGDGEQASHWEERSNPLGIMDPTLHKGQKRNIAALDLQAMDAIGWDLNYNLRDGISSNELGLDLTTLKALSEQELADRLGISVADLYNNATGSAQALTGDRNQDLETMIENSKIYEWGTNPVCNPVNGVCTTCTDNNRNGICDSKEKPWQKAMWQLGSWQKSSDLEAKQVPESSSILALLGMGLLGIISLAKGRQS
jgi:hypothetical protein